MEYYSAIKKNAFESVLMRWIKLEPIIQSEVSQKEKPILYINVYIWNLERWWLWPYMRDSKRDTDVKNRLLDSVGEGKGGMIWEIALKHVYYHTWNRSPVQVHETGHSGLVHWDDPEGWAGEGGRREVQDGGHKYTHGWFMSMYGKTTTIL